MPASSPPPGRPTISRASSPPRPRNGRRSSRRPRSRRSDAAATQSLPRRPERGGLQDLVLLVGEERRRLAEIGLPGRIGIHGGAALVAVGIVAVGPEMDDAMLRAD